MNPNWQDTLDTHVQEVWQELLDVLTTCIEENLVSSQLAGLELEGLRERMTEAESAEDEAQLEGCLSRCKHLFGYYSALLRQKRRGDEVGPSLP